MKLKLKKSDAVIIAVLILVTIIGSYYALHKPPQEPLGNVFVCGNQGVPFRANISDCLAVQVQPSEALLTDILTSPGAQTTFLLVDPSGDSGTGASAYEIYKTIDSLYARTAVLPSIAYTQYWENQSQIPVLSIENATYEKPIIFLNPGQQTTLIEINGPQITLHAKNQYDLDAASCKVAILLIKDVMEC